MGDTATYFDYYVVIFRSLKYMKLKLHLQLYFCMFKLRYPAMRVTIHK